MMTTIMKSQNIDNQAIVHVYDAVTLEHIISSKHFDRRYAIGDVLSINLCIETDGVISYYTIVSVEDIPANGQMLYVVLTKLVKNDVELFLS